MNEPKDRWVTIATAIVVSLGVTACSNDSGDETATAGEHATADAAARDASPEGAGEGAATSEGSEEQARSEGGDEHARSEGDSEHERSEGEGEHGTSEEGDEHGDGGEEGEESGEYIGREDTWDATRRGARLVLSFDATSNAFVGTVENTTQQTLCAVRVEVHLSTGTELGPTERTDLSAGETTVVELPTEGEMFDTWTAHPERSPCAGA